MRQATHTAAVLAALLALPLGASSQSHACEYDECALRLNDSEVLQGRSSERIAGFGFFRPPDLAERLASSDSATWYLEVVEESYTRGRVIWFAGQIVSAAGALLYISPDKTTQAWGFALQALGFSTGWLGQSRVARAEDAMSRAIWWYNRDVARGASVAAGRR